ncbi:MAG: antibiotic biosynthesis monooxygenase [Candidatus Omnitrophica bacterium]|nr:antibiotic biosynthesis monooxygenase [Candidatus Omnitrophota bacterium]
MYVVCVTIHVKSEHVDPFIQATLENARQTRKEPGNIRFDVLQAEDDFTRFFLYECYKMPSDFTAHQQTEHYLTWRETVQDWMAEKRIGVKHNSIFPDDQSE